MQDAYELEENGTGLMAQQVPYHWRMRARSLGHGAFHGLKVNAAALVHSVARMAPGNWLAHGSARHARERMSSRAGGCTVCPGAFLRGRKILQVCPLCYAYDSSYGLVSVHCLATGARPGAV